MKRNDKFKFVLTRDNFLSKTQCDKLIEYFNSKKPQDSKLAGDYTEEVLNKKVRNNKEVIYEEKMLQDKLKMVFELANVAAYNYDIQEIEEIKLLSYDKGGKYKWHTDVGSKETSTRKLTAIVQLSNEKDYEGGVLEFGITDEDGDNNLRATNKQGSIIVFPSFLSHRITPLVSGKRYSLLTWMLGDTFK